MAFDAGTIIAHLDLDETSFDRKLRDAEARQKRFENEPHKIRLAEVFSTSDMARARRMFTMLDQQISRDAAQRMKAGGTGSVLGALNSLFSTQQVGGAPTAQQSAQQGMLGRIIRQGGAAAAPGPGGRGPSAGQVITALAAAGGDGGGRNIPPAGGGGGPPSGVVGGIMRGIGPGILGIGARVAGGIGLGGAAFGALPGLFGPLAGLGVAGVGLRAADMLLKGTGVTTFTQAYQAAQTAQQQAVTPLQKQQAAQQMQGVIQGAKAQGPATFALFNTINSLSNSWQSFAQSMAPLLAKGLAPVAAMFRGLLPSLHSFFAGAITLIRPVIAGVGDIAKIALPLLGSAFRAAAPLMKPLLDGLGQLVKGVLPGVISIVKATAGPIKVFGGILGMLGRDVGGLFKAMAPAVAASMPILKALAGVIGGILPVVGKLAAYFAKLLAPVFAQFAAALKALTPFLLIVGKVLGQLAAAILGDLAMAFGALAKLLVGIAPSLTILAGALGQVFKILESSGVFALLGSALEKVAPLLARLVNSVVVGLAPILPPLINLIGLLVNIIIQLASSALQALLPPLIQLVNALLPALVPLIIALLPLVTLLARLIGDVLGFAIKLIAPLLMIMARDLGNVITWVARLLTAVVNFVVGWRHSWDEIKAIIGVVWGFIWNTFGAPVERFFTSTLPGWFATAWSTIQGTWKTVSSWWSNLPSVILGDISSLGGKLFTWGKGVITSMWNGFKAIWTTVTSWFGGLVKDVLHALGVHSPPDWAVSAGKSIMEGILSGFHLAGPGGNTKGTIRAIGGTVAGWITQALRIAGAPLSWLGALEVLVSKESGGNPRAYNPTSVGGQHATGLFQTLPSTFSAYSLGGSIFDPVADAVAGIRYLRARYGSPYNIPGLLGGVYQGYDTGGWLMPVNMTSKPEAVLNPGQSQAFVALAEAAHAMASGQGSSEITYKLDCLIAEVRKSGPRTGVAMGRVLGGVATQAAMAGWYGGS